jgi:uncharacterized delta-60 repeat protein
MGVVMQNDNRIDVVGYTTVRAGIAGDAVVARLLGDGRPDTSFNGVGHLVLSNDGNDFGFGVGLGPDGSIVITSFQSQRRDTVTDSFLNRITIGGTLDRGFGTDGTVRVHNAEATFELGLAIQPDGKIVVAGRRGGFGIVDSVGTIDRFRQDGSFDTTA